jgi:hypothetical protein
MASMKEYEIQKEKSDSGKDVFVYVQKESQKRIPLNSTYSPEREAEKFVRKHIGKKFYILVGIGNGSIVKKWMESDNNFVHLLIIEPFKQIEVDSTLREQIKKNEKVSFFYFHDLTPLSIVKYFQVLLGIDTEILIHPHYDKTDIEYLREIIDQLLKAQKLVEMNRNTELVFRKEWIIQPLLNLRYTKELTPVDELKDKFKGQKAILCSSGPSLKDNISFVKRMKKFAYIFASGSAVNGLINNGVEPDFTVVFDASKINYDAHFKNTKYRGILIAGTTTQADILHDHKGEATFCIIDSDYITQRIHKNVAVFSSSSSVSILAMQLIYYLGFSEVYLVGQDLALLNGQYYADGVHKHENLKFVNNDLYVENNMGEKVVTTLSLYSNLESFNDLMKLINPNKTKVYNLSKYGAKIKGVPYCDPDNIWPKDPRKEVQIELKPKKITVAGLEACKSILDEFKALQEEVEIVKSKLCKLNEKVVSEQDMKQVLKWFKKLRNHSILEDVIIKQLFFYVQKLSNEFHFKMDKSCYSNEDRVEMVTKIKHFVSIVEQYLLILLEDERIKVLEEQISAELSCFKGE